MSELLGNLALGLSVAAHPMNILFCLLGALVGTLVGVLPGIGTVATIAMLLPITFGLPPVGALIMLAGIYYGAQYGGSTTSVLVNIPGEATSVVTCLDGHQMARQGRAGAALSIAAIGSFFAGCTSAGAVAAGVASGLSAVAADCFLAICLSLHADSHATSRTFHDANGVIQVAGIQILELFLGNLLNLSGIDFESLVFPATFGLLLGSD